MNRFVVLLHETPATYERQRHFDLMLELDAVLLTWAVSEIPSLGRTLTAERLADHRVMYLDYEGPISGDRGSVRRVDGGNLKWLETAPRRYVAQVAGEKLRGRLVLEQEDTEAQRWRVDLFD